MEKMLEMLCDRLVGVHMTLNTAILRFHNKVRLPERYAVYDETLYGGVVKLSI
jgi:hypothetical protein